MGWFGERCRPLLWLRNVLELALANVNTVQGLVRVTCVIHEMKLCVRVCCVCAPVMEARK
jgi:hypothetical protein